MAEKKSSYAGRLSNSGAQKVEAPFGGKKKSRAVVKKGDDLRTSKPTGKGKR
jgi:hypothetical protein